jgi:hypothetical protein
MSVDTKSTAEIIRLEICAMCLMSNRKVRFMFRGELASVCCDCVDLMKNILDEKRGPSTPARSVAPQGGTEEP